MPNARHAGIGKSKIYNYLLNPLHPVAYSKAELFRHFGFERKNWKVLRDALLGHARKCPVVLIVDSNFGVRFTIEGPLRCPNGRKISVRSVWQIDIGTVAPRLITSYPLEKAYDQRT